MARFFVMLVWAVGVAEITQRNLQNNKDLANSPAQVAVSPVRLGTIPSVTLAPREPVSQEEAKEIKSLIASLAKLDSLTFDFSSDGDQPPFAPVRAMDGASPRSAGLRLVEKGPRALPFLLDALDDRTPTKIVIPAKTWDWDPGNWQMAWNRVNAAEVRVLSRRKKEIPSVEALAAAWFGPITSPYTVKVGDVCFVIVGEIVGRQFYQFVSGVGFITQIASPTHDAEMRADIRSIWGSKNPAKGLLDSLLRDYATQGIYNDIPDVGVPEVAPRVTVAEKVTLVPKVTGEAGLKVTVVCVELTDGAKIHGSTP
jgi:hypothetical protein